MQVPPTFQNPATPPPPPGRVRFEAIGEAWRWYMADMGSWILSLLLVLAIAIIPIVILNVVIALLVLSGGGITSGGGAFGSPAQAQASHSVNLISTLAAVPVSIFTQLLVAGLQRRALLQVRGYRPDVGEVFRLNGMGVQVLLFNVFYVLLTLPFQLLFIVSSPTQPFAIFEPTRILASCGLGIVMYSIQMLISFTPLIIVDQRLPVGPALKLCLATYGPQFFSLLGVMIVAGLLAGCGVLACGIGALFTLPVAFVVYGVIYNDHFRPAPPAPIEGEYGAYPRPQ